MVNGVLMLPVYFKYISVSEYGSWLAAFSFISFVGVIESGLGMILTQKLSESKVNEDHFLGFSGINIFIGLVLAILTCILSLFSPYFLINFLSFENNDIDLIGELVYVGGLGSALAIMTSFIGVFAQVWQETRFTGFMSVLINVAGIFLVIFLLMAGYGVRSLAYGYFIRSFINLVGISIWFVASWYKKKLSMPTVDLKDFRDVLVLSIWPFFARMSTFASTNLQNFLVAIVISSEATVVLDLTGKIINVLGGFVPLISSSYFGLLSLSKASKNKSAFYSVFATVSKLTVLSLMTALLFSLVSTKFILFHWLGDNKFGGYSLLLLILLSVFFIHSRNFFTNLLYSGGFVVEVAKLEVTISILYCILLFLLITFLGIYTFPIATILSSLLLIRVYFRLVVSKFYVSFKEVFRFSMKLFVVVSVLTVVHFILNLNLYNLSTFIITLSLYVLIYLSVVVVIERRQVKKIFENMMNFI